MQLFVVQSPTIEYPQFRYNDDNYKIINVPPLKEFSKNAPSISEIRLRSPQGNYAIVESLQRYAGNSEDVRRFSKHLRPRPQKEINYESFEKTRDQSNAILFQTFYFTILFVGVIMWFVLFR